MHKNGFESVVSELAPHFESLNAQHLPKLCCECPTDRTRRSDREPSFLVSRINHSHLLNRILTIHPNTRFLPPTDLIHELFKLMSVRRPVFLSRVSRITFTRPRIRFLISHFLPTLNHPFYLRYFVLYVRPRYRYDAKCGAQINL